MRKYFTLVELMVVFAVLVILISFLQPAMKVMLANAQRVQCQNNLKQLGTTFDIYLSDQTIYPDSGTHSKGWVNLGAGVAAIKTGVIWPYIQAEPVFACPADESGYVRTYSVSGRVSYLGTGFLRPTDSPKPSNTMLLLEEHDPRGWNMGSYYPGGWGGWVDNVAGWHDNGIHLNFMDGHVDYHQWQDPFTPTRFLESGNFRTHPDMIYIQDVYSGGTSKP